MLLRLNTKNRNALEKLFVDPISKDIRWDEVKSLLNNLGAEIVERSGSRVAIIMKTRKAIIHKPHPGNILRRRTIENLRRLLKEEGAHKP